MPRPCINDHELSPGKCELCRLFELRGFHWHMMEYGVPPGRPIPDNPPEPPKKSSCIHLGTVLERTDKDGVACGCQWKWLMKCEIHEKCTVGDQREGVTCCASCLDYDSDG